MKFTKQQLFESALALNGDDKKYVITVEGDKIITRVKWMDAVLFSPTAISDEMRDFEYTVRVNDNGTYNEIEKYVSSSKSAGVGGLSFGKNVFVGKRKQYSRTIGLGIDKQKDDSGVIVDITFNSDEYKDPIRTLMKASGYKKKMWPLTKLIIALLISLLLALILVISTISIVITLVAKDAAKEPTGADEFEALARSSGYSIQIDENIGKGYDTRIAKDEKDDYEMIFYTLSDSEKAKEFFESKRSDLDKIASANKGDFSTSSVSGSVFQRYGVSTSEIYMYVARVENTVILVSAGIEDKEEVKNFIKGIGY